MKLTQRRNTYSGLYLNKGTKMKKLFLLLVIGTLFIVEGWSQGGNEKDAFRKISNISQEGSIKGAIGNNFSGKTVYYLGGFDFEGYKKNHPTLDELTKAEAYAVVKGPDPDLEITWVSQAQEPYSIVGYSQGGLRALAYISEVKREYPPEELDKIDAVITISGIAQGIKMLDGGFVVFKRKATEKANIVGNGLTAVSVAFIDLDAVFFGGTLTTLTASLLETLITTTTVTAASFPQGAVYLLSLIPSIPGYYWAEAWLNPYSADLPQVDGMIPGSAYIRKNVVKNVEHEYKVQTASKIVVEWRYTIKLGIKIWYLWAGKVPVYAYPIQVEAVPQFDTSVPVGFIVGTSHNSLEQAENEEGIRKGIKAAEITFGVAEGYHIAKCVGLIGLFTGSPIYAVNAGNARLFMKTFDSQIYDMLGSKEGDGFVALQNQYIPATFTDRATGITRTNLPNVLGDTKEGFVRVPRNHSNIVTTVGAQEKANNSAIAFEYAGRMINEARENFRHR